MNSIKEHITGTEKSALINMCIKPIGMIISLVYVPFLLKYLGDEQYGLWATLLSIINWVNYFDVGIGNGLRNILSSELSLQKLDEARKSVSTAYVVLTLISLGIYVLLIISVFLFDWHSILSTNINVKPVLLICFTFICINFVLALSNTLWYALQKSENVAIRSCIVQALNLVGVILLDLFTDGSLVAMSILFGASTMSVYLLNTLKIMRHREYLRPTKRFFEKEKVNNICNIGFKFFFIQIFCILIFTVDNILISHYFGAEMVTPFSIANKVFNTAYTVLAAFLVPYWSMSTVAFTNGDYLWLINAIKRTFKVCVIFIGGYFIVFLLFKPVVGLWLGRQLDYQYGLLLLMFIFYSLYSVLAVECQFINGSGKINTQLIIYAIIGILNIPSSIFLGVNMELGPLGIRLATTILIFIEVIVLGFNLHRIMKQVQKD